MNASARRRELAAFLRSRRQRLDPAALGLDPGRRRAPGLRREEVAALAGVSLSWYTWLEQARDIHASAEVLTSIARALSLDHAEVEYLLRLGGHVPPRPLAPDRPDPREDPRLHALTDGFMPNPASIVTPSFDYVAWNSASERIVPRFLGCSDDGTYNLARFIFSGDAQRNPVKGPKEGVHSIVASLRANAARYPDDGSIDALAEELSDASTEFARIWRLREVCSSMLPPEVPLEHPDVGLLRFARLNLSPELYPELTLVVFLPRDDATAAGLGALVGG